MPLLKRSYEKQSNMLNGKIFFCRNLYGDYLDKYPYKYGYDINNSINGLTVKGKTILTNFIILNKKREQALLKKEQKLLEDSRNHKIQREKTPIWKSGLKIIEHFGGPLIDKCHKFRESPIVRYKINQPPFRRTKITGEYFDNNIFRQE